jgi:hypothetical protein
MMKRDGNHAAYGCQNSAGPATQGKRVFSGRWMTNETFGIKRIRKTGKI